VNPAELAAEIALLKDESKLARDAGDYAGAIDQLSLAIELIDNSGWDDGLDPGAPVVEDRRKIAWHLADCLGMLGGNYRRIEQLDEAVRCFERGRLYEQDSRFQVSSSYNSVNAIVAPIEAKLRDATSQTAALRDAVSTLERQIFDPDTVEASRRLDRWAWADLGQCQLLLGNAAEARAAYQRFIELSDAATIQSSRDVLRSIERALRAKNDERAGVVAAGIEFLDSA